MSERIIRSTGTFVLEQYPEIFWTWQQEMRKKFPQHWEKIKDARDPSDVILYMNRWLGTDVALNLPIDASCEVWLAEMRKQDVIIVVH